jgi:fructose-1-phosphate kinase PfkB-like protein
MKITDISDGMAAVKRLVSLGARSAAISLGEQGLLWYSGREAEVYYAKAIDVRPRSTVGSGDAAVAAFAYATGARCRPRNHWRWQRRVVRPIV